MGANTAKQSKKSSSKKPATLNLADKQRLLKAMLFARRFEERCYEGYVERKIGGFLHLYSGQEACCYVVL